MAIGVELAAVGVELIPGIAGADNVTIGTSTITGGTNGRVLYDNSGVIGEKATTGSGSVVLATAPTVSLPVVDVLTLTPTAFGSLPVSPTFGMVASVSDSNTVTWGATISGGSTNKVLAFYNGTNWTVIGK